jgi:hypothetical protein
MPCPRRFAKVTLVHAAEWTHLCIEFQAMTTLWLGYLGISNVSQIQEILLKLNLIPENLLGDEISICFSTSISKGNPDSGKKYFYVNGNLFNASTDLPITPIIVRNHYEMPSTLGKGKASSNKIVNQ